MANEAVTITLLGNAGDPVEYTVATDTDITKGSLMYISSSPQTILPVSAGSQLFAGIASTDFESGASTGTDKLACWTHGVFDLTAGSAGTMVLGAPVCSDEAGANTVGVMTDDTIELSAAKVGIAYETVTAGNVGAVLVNV